MDLTLKDVIAMEQAAILFAEKCRNARLKIEKEQPQKPVKRKGLTPEQEAKVISRHLRSRGL